MKIRIHIETTVIVVLMAFQFTASAQIPDSSSLEISSPDLETQLVSLDSITVIALKNSPYLKFDSVRLKSSEQDVILAKRRWQSHVSAFANYSQGNSGFLTTAGVNDVQNNLFSGYRYGLNVSIPLSEFTTRKFYLRKSKADFSSLEYKKEQTEMELKRQIVSEYNNLLMAQKILKIKGSGKENSLVLQQLAERQFREGTITLEEYANVSDMTVRSEVDFEMAKNNFKTLYLQFEDLIGVQLTTLMRKK